MKDKIKVIINEFDPLDVLPYAPNDEYDLEVEKIFEYISNEKNIDSSKLGTFIYDIFIKELTKSAFFNTLDDCENVAKKIIDVSIN